MSTDSLTWLQQWYLAQCDGDWEHQRGLKIETLDNPGWAVEIDLGGTPYAGAVIAPLDMRRSDRDWLVYKTEDDKFRAHCGPLNLTEAIEAFRRWIDDAPAHAK
jgi:hypothetical protein